MIMSTWLVAALILLGILGSMLNLFSVDWFVALYMLGAFFTGVVLAATLGLRQTRR